MGHSDIGLHYGVHQAHVFLPKSALWLNFMRNQVFFSCLFLFFAALRLREKCFSVAGCWFFRGDGWGWVRDFDGTDKIPGSGDAGPGMTMRGGTVGWVSGIHKDAWFSTENRSVAEFHA
jgi:hypothetical protein